MAHLLGFITILAWAGAIVLGFKTLTQAFVEGYYAFSKANRLTRAHNNARGATLRTKWWKYAIGFVICVAWLLAGVA